jgi:hypothetical protein
MRKILSLFLLWVALTPAPAQDRRTQNVVLVILDGWRWQELFGGADSLLIRDKRFVSDTAGLIREFWAPDPISRREKIMPFFWEWIGENGQVYGNRRHGNFVNTTNTMWFSYPGYSEILCGFADDERVNSNKKIPNPNVTVLEYLQQQPAFRGKVAAFGSWDVFPAIINEGRSCIPVNAGWQPVAGKKLTPRQLLLNELQQTLPKEWESVRYDAITYQLAKEHIAKHQPRVLFLSLGETDDFAHDGHFDHYLRSARATDRILEDLWTYLQTLPQYKDKTTFILTTDHGRGDRNKDQWKDHGSKVPDAGEIWLAVAGPDTPVRGKVKEAGQLYQNQVAATLAALLGIKYEVPGKTGKAIGEVKK